MKKGTNMKKNMKNLMMLLILTGLTASHINGADNPPSYNEAMGATTEKQQPGFFQRVRQSAGEKWDALKGKVGTAKQSASQAAASAKQSAKQSVQNKLQQLKDFINGQINPSITKIVKNAETQIYKALATTNKFGTKVMGIPEASLLSQITAQYRAAIQKLEDRIAQKASTSIQQQASIQLQQASIQQRQGAMVPYGVEEVD